MTHGKLGTRKTRAILILLLTLAAFPLTATGLPEYQDHLPDQGANFGCHYCHVSRNGGGPLNGFGIDFEENNRTYDDSLGAIDSDGDGFLNSQELQSRPVTNPGDPDSYPVEGGARTFILIFLAVVVMTVIVGLLLIWKKR